MECVAEWAGKWGGKWDGEWVEKLFGEWVEEFFGKWVLLLGNVGAAGKVTWAPAREIADHTPAAETATTMPQTTAQTIKGS